MIEPSVRKSLGHCASMIFWQSVNGGVVGAGVGVIDIVPVIVPVGEGYGVADSACGVAVGAGLAAAGGAGVAVGAGLALQPAARKAKARIAIDVKKLRRVGVWGMVYSLSA
jgi:hypothetical protein